MEGEGQGACYISQKIKDAGVDSHTHLKDIEQDRKSRRTLM